MYKFKNKLIISEYKGIIKHYKNLILELKTQKNNIGNQISAVIKEKNINQNDIGLNFAYIAKEQELAECMSNLRIYSNIVSVCLTRISELKDINSNHKGNINLIDISFFCHFERFLRYSKNYITLNGDKLLVVEILNNKIFECINEKTKEFFKINMQNYKDCIDFKVEFK